MEFTITGIILFLIGIFFWILIPKYLYHLTIFFIPFTATAIVNFHSGFWLTPFQLFGVLWLISKAQNSFLSKKSLFPKHLKLSLILVYSFIAVVFLSATMPIIIAGNLSIASGYLGDFSTSTLMLTTRNFTAPFYVLFGGIFSLLIAAHNSFKGILSKTLRIIIFSSAFTSCWGLFQFISFFLGIKYPNYIFNNTANEDAQQYDQILANVEGFSSGLIRMSSVATEPSVLAQFLVTVIPILLFSIFLKRPFFSRFIDSIILFLNIIVLLLSTSASAYIGVIFITFYTLITLLNLRLISTKVIFLFISIICILLYIYFEFDAISKLVDLYLFNKLSTGSGSERLKTIGLAFSYFVRYPILGIGWGSVTSFDMFVFILSSTGILGFIIFSSLIFYPIKTSLETFLAYKKSILKFGEYASISAPIGILISFISLLSVQTLSGFWYGYGYFWLILGLAMTIKPNILSIKNLLLKSVQQNTAESTK